MKVYAPNKNANGFYASVRFVDGVGETDDPKLLEWFRSHGYKLSGNFTTTVPAAPVVPVVSAEQLDQLVEEVEVEPDFDNMTPNELRQWAIEHGLGTKIRNIRNKEKLLEILRG